MWGDFWWELMVLHMLQEWILVAPEFAGQYATYKKETTYTDTLLGHVGFVGSTTNQSWWLPLFLHTPWSLRIVSPWVASFGRRSISSGIHSFSVSLSELCRSHSAIEAIFVWLIYRKNRCQMGERVKMNLTRIFAADSLLIGVFYTSQVVQQSCHSSRIWCVLPLGFWVIFLIIRSTVKHTL